MFSEGGRNQHGGKKEYGCHLTNASDNRPALKSLVIGDSCHLTIPTVLQVQNLNSVWLGF